MLEVVGSNPGRTNNNNYSFFPQCVSGRNSTNPAIWLVPGVGGIFPSGPLSAGGIIKNVPSFSGNLFSDLCYYGNKNLSVKSLSSSWITSVFITICLLEIVQFVANLTMITALKCSGLSYAFCCVVEKNKNVIHQLRSVRIGKNCALCLEYRLRLQASGGIQDLGHSFSQYRPPGWWITYIFIATLSFLKITGQKSFLFLVCLCIVTLSIICYQWPSKFLNANEKK